MVAIAYAAPELQSLNLTSVELTCHPAIVCAIVAGYCEHIEDVHVDDTCQHVWKSVEASDVIGAYHSATAATARSGGYKPFTQLRHLLVTMCWCTPAPVWHALLSLTRHAVCLRAVNTISLDEPLAVSALSYLPSLTALSSHCLVPVPFGTFMQSMSRRPLVQFRFVTCEELCGFTIDSPIRTWKVFELSDGVEQSATRCKVGQNFRQRLHRAAKGEMSAEPIILRPRSALFTAYQHTLDDSSQTPLARWASGDFDEAPTQTPATSMQTDAAEQAASVDHQLWPRARLLHHWNIVRAGQAMQVEEKEVVDLIDDDEKRSGPLTLEQAWAARK